MVSQIIPPGSVFHPSQILAYEVHHPGYESYGVPAYVARPSGSGAFPGVVITHGVHGYEEHMKEVARRFAALGYACIVPALYCREDFLAVVEEDIKLAIRHGHDVKLSRRHLNWDCRLVLGHVVAFFQDSLDLRKRGKVVLLDEVQQTSFEP